MQLCDLIKHHIICFIAYNLVYCAKRIIQTHNLKTHKNAQKLLLKSKDVVLSVPLAHIFGAYFNIFNA